MNLEEMIPLVIQIGISAVIILAFISLNALFLVWLERKLSARIQLRLGPMQAGFQGFLQTFADAIKLLGKEQISPNKADKWVYLLAPLVMFTPTVILFVTIPFSSTWVVKDLELGFLFVLALSSLSVIAVFMAGWASNNKYSLLGSMRGVAQHVAYTIPLLFAALAIAVQAGTLSLSGIVNAQNSFWFIFLQPITFIIFFIGSVAETNRAPFDIPEAESELVAGFMTEYSGMRFALFFLAEYTNMFIMSALITLAFLGGWEGPILPAPVWFLIKTYILIAIMMWARFTFPRLRSDQLMNFCWKILIPVSIINLIVIGFLVGLGH